MGALDFSETQSLILDVVRGKAFGIGADLLVVPLEGGQILSRLVELAFLHALTNVPVHESTLVVHQIELVVEAAPGLRDGSGVAQHANGAVDPGERTIWVRSRCRDNDGLLVVNTDLEAGRAPLDEVERLLGLETGDGGVALAGDNITAVQERYGHVLSGTWVADDHLVVGLEALQGQFLDLEALVAGLLGGDDWGVGDERVVDAREGDEVGLELVQIDVERTVKAEGGGDRRHDLGDQAVEMLEVGAGNVERTAADVVNSLIVDEEGAVRVLNGRVGGEHSVVWLNNGSGNARRRVDGELELALLAVVGAEAFQKEGAETRSSATTE